MFAQRTSVSISCGVSQLVMNTFSFCMSESEFISPSWLKSTFAEYRILDCHLKIFYILSRCCYIFLSLALFSRTNMLSFLNLFLGMKCVFSSSGWSYIFLIIVLKPYWTWLCSLTSLLFTLGFLHLHIVLLEVVPSAHWCSFYLFWHPFDFGLFYILYVST